MTVAQVIQLAASSLAILFTLGGGIIVLLRASSWKQIGQEWKDLAQARSSKIADLERRITDMEHQLAIVLAENAQLRELNMKYQAELMARSDNG